jgi:hypothetical protein
MICSKSELDIKEDIDTHWIRDMGKDLDDISEADLGVAVSDKYSRLESDVIDVDNK